MRDILFMAKRIDNGEWVEGYFYIDSKTNKGHIICYVNGIMLNYIVKKDTLCQYTGLTDKNGNKIWEGDIFVCCYNNSRGKRKVDYYAVTYDNECGVWQPFGDSGCGFDPKSIEIIGNIFDNPELIGGDA